MDTSLTDTYVGYGYETPLLPIFSIGKVTKRQSDQKSIFGLEGSAQFLHRDIASRLRDGHVSGAQYSRKDRWRSLHMKPLGKSLPITFPRRHSRPPELRLVGVGTLNRIETPLPGRN